MSLFVMGQPKANAESLKKAAEKGDPKAQLNYGKSLTDSSREEAGKWIQKAADQGLGEAWYWLGYAGLGSKNELYYYEKAAELKYKDAFDHLFDALIFRAGSSSDINKAKKYADLARKFRIDLGFGGHESLQTIDRCFAAGPLKIPDTDQPSENEKKKFRLNESNCSLLLETDNEQEKYITYRKCLLSQEDPDNTSLGEIYANGWGVKRNANLALAFVCRGSTVPAELIAMVDFLNSTKDQERLQTEFKFCDFTTSGLNSGLCAAQAEEVAIRQREKELKEITKNWTDKQKMAFEKLILAAEDFFSESASSEQDLSGSGRAQFVIDEQANYRQDFLSSIQAFEGLNWPTDDNFTSADKQLNEAYTVLMNRQDQDYKDNGTITKEGIRQTQRKWIVYRDRWVEFGSVRYPQISANILKTWLTLKRVSKLEAILPPE
jgi:uncharacterized protein YecT (DUF1311 family)